MERSPTRVLHVDMDAFFASVEQLDHPEWRGKPVIVGAGPHERGVVSTCSYEARRFGVHSAMPSRTAFARCPQGIFAPPRMTRYSEMSERVFEIFGHYSPFVEAVSIDEAYLDITGTLRLFGGTVALGEKLRTEVRESCGVTCSVGIGPNRLLAKIASDFNKPDGLFETPYAPGEIRAFLAPQPIGILRGVGGKTREVLESFGFRTCGDLQNADKRILVQLLGDSAAETIHAHAFGIDDATVAREAAPEKSVSREITFDEDESDRAVVRAALLELVADVGRRFRRERRWARTAKIKVRDFEFNTFTRQCPFELPARDDRSFRDAALALFDAACPPLPAFQRPFRLIGFGVTDFVSEPGAGEMSLFGPDPRIVEREKQERLSTALDRIHRRG